MVLICVFLTREKINRNAKKTFFAELCPRSSEKKISRQKRGPFLRTVGTAIIIVVLLQRKAGKSKEGREEGRG